MASLCVPVLPVLSYRTACVPQEAVKDLFTSSDYVAEQALVVAETKQAKAPGAAGTAKKPGAATPVGGAAAKPAVVGLKKKGAAAAVGTPTDPAVEYVTSNFDVNLALDELVLKASRRQHPAEPCC